MSDVSPVPAPILALVVAPLTLAALQVAVAIALLHRPVAESMRARGHASWRVADTLLTVPLLTAALAVACGAANRGLARLAWDLAHGRPWGAHAAATAAATLGALVVAAFGLRAVKKLY